METPSQITGPYLSPLPCAHPAPDTVTGLLSVSLAPQVNFHLRAFVPAILHLDPFPSVFLWLAALLSSSSLSRFPSTLLTNQNVLPPGAVLSVLSVPALFSSSALRSLTFSTRISASQGKELCLVCLWFFQLPKQGLEPSKHPGITSSGSTRSPDSGTRSTRSTRSSKTSKLIII